MSAFGPEFSVELTYAKSLSPRVRGLTLRVVGAQSFEWQQGQYVELALDATAPAALYSIASAPSAKRPGEFELAISRSGVAPDLAVGALLRARGPFGSLLRKQPRGAPLLLVATGTGLAPLRALLQDDVARGGQDSVTLLFGCRNESDMLWREELEALSRSEERFSFQPSLSRAGDQWTGRRGHVQTHLLELLEQLPGAEVYLCGFTEMVRDCRALLLQQGTPADRLIGEAY